MKNLAIIGASYLQLPLIRKAKEMGFITHVFAWAANDVGEKEADFFYPISIIEKDAILKKCEEIGIVGICSIASDLASITVNYVASNLNLNANDHAYDDDNNDDDNNNDDDDNNNDDDDNDDDDNNNNNDDLLNLNVIFEENNKNKTINIK